LIICLPIIIQYFIHYSPRENQQATQLSQLVWNTKYIFYSYRQSKLTPRYALVAWLDGSHLGWQNEFIIS